jgi:hypothetical protein
MSNLDDYANALADHFRTIYAGRTIIIERSNETMLLDIKTGEWHSILYSQEPPLQIEIPPINPPPD